MSNRTTDSALGSILRHNVNAALSRHGITAAEFCARTGITRSAFSRLFKSEHGPRLRSIATLARALGVQTFELLLPAVVQINQGDDQ